MRNEKARLLIRRAFGSAPRRTRTYNPLIKSQQPEDSKMHPVKGLRLVRESIAPLPTDTCKTDPDLAAVVAAWSELPEAIKAGILAMVKAASTTITTPARFADSCAPDATLASASSGMTLS